MNGAQRLADLRWPEVDPASLLVIPLGSTEQHGPHLPLSTDTDIAAELARRFAAIYAGAVVAPPVAYGSAGEHGEFPGTLSIGQQALTTLVVELIRSSHFARTLVINGHGGNELPLTRAVAILQAEGRDVLAWSPRLPGGDAHAGHAETSLFLAAFPGHVGSFASVTGNHTPLRELMPALRAGRLRDIAPSGVLGDPTTANAADGAVLWAELLADLVAAALARWAPVGAL